MGIAIGCHGLPEDTEPRAIGVLLTVQGAGAETLVLGAVASEAILTRWGCGGVAKTARDQPDPAPTRDIQRERRE